MAQKKIYARVLESDKNYRTLLEGINGWAWEADRDGVYTYASPRVKDLLGYEPAEIIGKTRFDLMRPDESERARAIFSELASLKHPILMLENPTRHKDGRLVILETSGIPILDDQGEFCGYCGVNRDITARKESEETQARHRERLEELVAERTNALRQSEASLKLAQGIAKIGIYELKLETGELHWSDNLYRLFGYQPGEVVPSVQLVGNHIHPEDRKRVSQKANWAIKHEASLSLEFRIIRGDGSVRHCESISEAVRDQVQDKLVGFRGILQDVTKRKLAEGALKTSQNSLYNLVENSGDGILVLDMEGEIRFVNFAATQILGRSKEDLIGAQFGLPLSLDEPTEVDIVLKGGKPGTGHLCATHTEWYGELAHLISIRDVTASKMLEKQTRQSQKLEAVGTLAGGIAHDFNNILSIIVGQCEIASMDLSKDSPIQGNLGSALQACGRAADLVRQILNFSRQAEPDKIALELTPLIKEALRFFRSAVPKHIKIRQNLRALQRQVLADPTQIYQVIINLCNNAAQAMGQEGGVIEVGLEEITLGQDMAAGKPGPPPGVYQRLTVKDTGCGMTPEVAERVFEPFFTTKGVGEGTGLGLSVVHGIVEEHHGSISVASQPGMGSTFEVCLPALPMKTDRQDAEIVTDDPPFGAERIILVDDEEGIIATLRHTLTSFGYQVRGDLAQ